MFFPPEIWKEIKNYMLGKEYWKRKMQSCFIDGAPRQYMNGYFYSYIKDVSIKYYKPIIFSHRAERSHFNLVTEYWKALSHSNKSTYRIEPVTRWITFEDT
tara:strand:- start:213 stop:515 length:303 start_codon:yes stop_codon:yes gene_type:complete